MVNLFIANTDNRWFDFLASEPNITEVNFWWPGEMAFRALQPGELLIFRLKSPRNKIGGFGVFFSHSLSPLQLAWDSFGRANGAPSFEALRTAISGHRTDTVIGPTSNIGCTILLQPTFFPEHLWFDLPLSWSSSIQRGKRYSTENVEGRELWNRLQEAAQGIPHEIVPGLSEIQARYGAPTIITPRLGQGAFRIAVTEAYGRQCAVTEGKVLPALDAAHIKPYGEGGLHTKSNGILLRKDIHCVFDAGYATVDEDYRFSVSQKIRDIFNNGEEYLKLHGKLLRRPVQQSDWPDREFLRWHNNNRYVG